MFRIINLKMFSQLVLKQIIDFFVDEGSIFNPNRTSSDQILNSIWLIRIQILKSSNFQFVLLEFNNKN